MVGITFRIKYDKTIVGTVCKLKIEAPEFKKVTKWGTRRYDEKEEE